MTATLTALRPLATDRSQLDELLRLHAEAGGHLATLQERGGANWVAAEALVRRLLDAAQAATAALDGTLLVPSAHGEASRPAILWAREVGVMQRRLLGAVRRARGDWQEGAGSVMLDGVVAETRSVTAHLAALAVGA